MKSDNDLGFSGAVSAVNSSTDHFNVNLVSVPLTGDNYLSWRRSIILALGARDKMDYISESFEAPEVGDKEYKNWKRQDCVV